MGRIYVPELVRRKRIAFPNLHIFNEGGCWFCPKQPISQLRFLRKNYPELWVLMLKWDADSPVTFKPGYRDRNGVYHEGKTVYDYEERFHLEDEGLIRQEEKFSWTMIEDGGVNYRLF